MSLRPIGLEGAGKTRRRAPKEVQDVLHRPLGMSLDPPSSNCSVENYHYKPLEAYSFLARKNHFRQLANFSREQKQKNVTRDRKKNSSLRTCLMYDGNYGMVPQNVLRNAPRSVLRSVLHLVSDSSLIFLYEIGSISRSINPSICPSNVKFSFLSSSQ